MSTPLLQALNLRKKFALSDTPFKRSAFINALDGVNLTLYRGETLGIAGESGCGKSTAAKILMGLEHPTSGDILFKGSSIAAFNRDEKLIFRRSVQMIFQDPYSSLNPRMRVGEIIEEPLVIHRAVKSSDRRERVLNIMKSVGLTPEQFGRYPHEFSGGQKQRISIARALALNPEVIIADEPLSALDISIQAQIINLLIELQASLGLSYILISHDLAVIRHLSTRVAIMYLGRIVEQAATEELFSTPRHPYTEALLAAVPGFAAHRESTPLLEGDLPSPVSPPSGCPFHPRCRYRKDICMSVIPAFEEKSAGHFAACHLSRELFP